MISSMPLIVTGFAIFATRKLYDYENFENFMFYVIKGFWSLLFFRD